MKALFKTFSLILFIPLIHGSGTHEQGQPNVILCMADDLGWGDTSYNGNPVIRTPHLDQMARDGIQFNRFYAAARVCSPTRASGCGLTPSRLNTEKHKIP